jgi:hypothetical protein
MIRNKFVALTLALASVASVSTSAYAFPHFGLHRNPETAQTQDTRISVVVHNKSSWFRDVKVGDRVYTVMPHASLEIKAPVGTPVYTETTGARHTKGDLLFAVKPELQNKTISID